jgi:hypothetical protein
VLNPLDKLAFRLGIPPPGDALLETIARRLYLQASTAMSTSLLTVRIDLDSEDPAT